MIRVRPAKVLEAPEAPAESQTVAYTVVTLDAPVRRFENIKPSHPRPAPDGWLIVPAAPGQLCTIYEDLDGRTVQLHVVEGVHAEDACEEQT